MLWYLLSSALLAQVSEPDLGGRWVNKSGSVVVLVARCADADWCGTVEWASEKATSDAARGGTVNLVGTQVLERFAFVGPNHWKGRLFVPDINKRSKAELRLLDAERLQVRGCAVGRLLCTSQIWTRAEER